MNLSRRKLVKKGLTAGLGMIYLPSLASKQSNSKDFIGNKNTERISLAQWSLRSWLRSGKMSNLEFPATSKNVFGINAVEYVSTFFEGKETNLNYLKELRKRAEDENVKNILIMVDIQGPEGELASPNTNIRKEAAKNHWKWVDAASYLGCHAIRVNARGYESAGYDEAKKYFADGLSNLVEYGHNNKINILVENHGGLSSNGKWLAEVIESVNDEYCGSLPDFGNFRISKEDGIFYDPLVGLKELMPYAKGVSAKAHMFDSNGMEITIDYPKMLNTVQSFGYQGYIGIEWGGSGNKTMLPEEGIKTTKKLLVKYFEQI